MFQAYGKKKITFYPYNNAASVIISHFTEKKNKVQEIK